MSRRFDNTEMTAAQAIKCILAVENVRMAEVARQLDMSRQNISDKLRRESLTERDMVRIAETLGYTCRITFEKKES